MRQYAHFEVIISNDKLNRKIKGSKFETVLTISMVISPIGLDFGSSQPVKLNAAMSDHCKRKTSNKQIYRIK